VELIPTAISAGYAAGLNAYGTVLLLGLLGKSGFGEVPFADLDQVTGSEEVAAVGAGGSTGVPQPRAEGGPATRDQHLARALLQHFRQPDRGRALERRRQRRRGPPPAEMAEA
jgi:hypothetical protein